MINILKKNGIVVIHSICAFTYAKILNGTTHAVLNSFVLDTLPYLEIIRRPRLKLYKNL